MNVTEAELDELNLRGLAILTPSRGRPESLLRLRDSIFENADHPEYIKMFNYLDASDLKINEYKRLNKSNPPNKNWVIKSFIGPDVSVGNAWNYLALDAYTAGADVFIMGNDDLVYRTKGWDTILNQKLDDEKYIDDIYCAWFNDGINGERHCAFPMISRNWYELMHGEFAPSCFNFGYNDTWNFHIGQMIDRLLYIPEVMTEHLHFTVSKSEMDDTYKRNRSGDRGNLFQKDMLIFNETLAERQDRAKVLLDFIHGFETVTEDGDES